MSIAFCTFVKRDKYGIPVLKFNLWDRSVNLRVSRQTMHANFKQFTQEEYDAIDFESLNETPCFMWAYLGSEDVSAFGVMYEDLAKHLVSTTETSTFTRPEVSPYWISLCKQYDPTLESRLAEYLARKINIKLPDVKSDKEQIIREFVECILPDVEDDLSDVQKEALHEAIDNAIEKIKTGEEN